MAPPSSRRRSCASRTWGWCVGPRWPSEEGHLFAELLGVHGREVQDALQLAGRGGRMPREMIVDVTVHGAATRRELRDETGPELELARAVDLNARVIHDLAIGAHPS